MRVVFVSSILDPCFCCDLLVHPPGSLSSIAGTSAKMEVSLYPEYSLRRPNVLGVHVAAAVMCVGAHNNATAPRRHPADHSRKGGSQLDLEIHSARHHAHRSSDCCIAAIVVAQRHLNISTVCLSQRLPEPSSTRLSVGERCLRRPNTLAPLLMRGHNADGRSSPSDIVCM